MRVVVASLVAAAPLSLWGCGGDDTTASPGGGGGGGGGGVNRPSDYKPTTVQIAWDNHFGAFAEFNVDQIMWDYDGTSEITVFNDACMGTDPATSVDYNSPRGMSRYVGTTAIRGFFDSLFTQLGKDLSNVNYIGPKVPPGGSVANGNGTAEVRERGTTAPNPIANANVFLTWRTTGLDNPINFATDTFSWRQIDGNFWIDHQTIVITEPNSVGDKCSSTARRTPAAESTNLRKGWENHLAAFVNRSTVDYPGEFSMMADYDANSIIAVYDNRDQSYNVYDDETKIKQFFDDLFEEMRQAADPPTTDFGTANEGLRVGLLEIDANFNSVFLVWSSRSHLRATDTFIFTPEGKIARQNIVVTTRTPPGQSATAIVV